SWFSREVGEEGGPARAERDGGDALFHHRRLPAKQLAHLVDRSGRVHGTGEREPVIRRVAEGRNFSLRIDHRFLGKGADRPRSAKTYSHDSGANVASADRAHHVV